MRKFKSVTTQSEVLRSITCDVCKKPFDAARESAKLEIQEFHSINFVGGYGSIFGDGRTVQCDICQRCLRKLLEPYLRITDL